MAIPKNAGALGGKRISEPGEYLVKIHKTETGLSKKGKPMLTVTFETPDEKEIKGYFVKTIKFHMHNLKVLKIACGLKEADSADELLGKECGVLVEAQEPNEQGLVFMSIVGFGPAKDVSPGSQTLPDSFEAPIDDTVPF